MRGGAICPILAVMREIGPIAATLILTLRGWMPRDAVRMQPVDEFARRASRLGYAGLPSGNGRSVDTDLCSKLGLRKTEAHAERENV